MFCAEQVVQLHHHADKFETAGAELVVIGNGTPNFIEGFRDRTHFSGPVYTDPSREVYRALDLRRTLASNVNPRVIGSAVRALRHGFRQKRVEGDPWQQGGVFVVSSAGELVYAFRSSHAGDHPTVDEILTAAREATGGAA